MLIVKGAMPYLLDQNCVHFNHILAVKPTFAYLRCLFSFVCMSNIETVANSRSTEAYCHYSC